MSDTVIAALSDIHGNRWALEAVLSDMRRRGITRFVNLGDVVYGPLDPAGTMELLRDHGAPTVRGNEDRILFGEDRSDGIRRLIGSLREEDREFLRALPMILSLEDGIFLCHGTPREDDAYLFHRVQPGGARRRTASELEEMLEGVDGSLILCGHDHKPAELRQGDGRLVVNPGSVGLPAYTDQTPFPHFMENGSPEARYGILERSGNRWSAEFVSLPYDHEEAAKRAEGGGKPDWARWLRTGRAGIQPG